MEKVRKKIGKSISYRKNKYRVEKFKVDKFSDTASVEVGCWLDNGNYTAIGSVLRRVKTLHNISVGPLKDKGLDRMLFISDIKDTIIRTDSKRCFCTFLLQFNYKGLNVSLDEDVYNVVVEHLIKIILGSGLVLKDK